MKKETGLTANKNYPNGGVEVTSFSPKGVTAKIGDIRVDVIIGAGKATAVVLQEDQSDPPSLAELGLLAQIVLGKYPRVQIFETNGLKTGISINRKNYEKIISNKPG